jgi:hypothetical protein
MKRVPSAFFENTETVAVPAAATVSALLSPGWIEVEKCVMTPQQDKEWCWAACTQAVERAMATDVEQCIIAGDRLHRSCCGTGDPECLVQETLPEVLRDRGHLGDVVGHQLGFEDIAREIEAKRPVCCLIRFPTLNHFVVITGVSVLDRQLAVLDPAHDANDPVVADPYDYDALSIRYGDDGLWDDTFRTN